MKSILISDLFHVLRELRGMKVLLRVGLKRNSAKEKIDLLAGCDDGSIEKYFRPIKKLLEDQWPEGNFFECDDSVRFDLPTCSGGVAVYDAVLLVRQVEAWINGKNLSGQHRPWAIGYWLPEALCGDLATAKTLYDLTDTSVKLRELLVPYPASLSKFIVELCTEEIRQKLSTLEKLHEDANLERELCHSDVAASMVRFAFARSRIYFRGFRSLEEQAKQLKSSDLPIYKLALEFSVGKSIKDVKNEIDRLF